MKKFTAAFLFAACLTSNAATLTATGYCPCNICCGAMGGTGITASGARARQGVTVAASRSIPFGSRIIVGGRTFIVQDRLAKRYDNRLDFFFNTHAEAQAFGKRMLRVRILPKTIIATRTHLLL